MAASSRAGVKRFGWPASVALASVALSPALHGGCAGGDDTTARRIESVEQRTAAAMLELRADVQSTVDNTVARVEAETIKLRNRIGTLESQQSQSGIINIATSSGGGIAGYVVAVLLALVAWKVWRRYGSARESLQACLEAVHATKDRATCDELHRRVNPRDMVFRAIDRAARIATSTGDGSQPPGA